MSCASGRGWCAWRRCRMADGACICDHPNFSGSEDEYICDDEAQDGCFFFEEHERDCDCVCDWEPQ